MSSAALALTPHFADVLRACREEINARFTLMRREFADLDAESYFAFLRTGGDAVVRSVESIAAVETGCAVCEVALELVARNLAGPKSRTGWQEEAWAHLLPAAARIVSAEPRRVLGAVNNAVNQIAATLARCPPAQRQASREKHRTPNDTSREGFRGWSNLDVFHVPHGNNEQGTLHFEGELVGIYCLTDLGCESGWVPLDLFREGGAEFAAVVEEDGELTAWRRGHVNVLI